MIGKNTAETEFLTHLVSELLKSSPRREFNITDPVRFQSTPFSIKLAVKNKFIELAGTFGFFRASAIDDDLLNKVLKNSGLASAYGLLEDQDSRDLFVKLRAYRIMGHRHVRLPSNEAKY